MKKAKKIRQKNTGDLSIVLLVAMLTVFGTLMIFSASYYYSISQYDDPYHYLIRQLIWLAAGSAGMWVCSKIDYHFWVQLWFFAFAAGLILLLLVLTPLGSSAYGATRWIQIGPVTIMPGEIAKPCIILFITGFFSKHPKWATNLKKGILPVLAAAGIYGVLIMKQPNMSTAFTVCFIAGGMLLVAGARISHLFGLMCTAAMAGAVLILGDKSGYRYKRFLSFLDPFEDPLNTGWNVVQSLLALGTGGLTGRGLGNSIQKNLYLPMPQNDFILAIIGEELGFIGVLALIFVYLLLIWRGCHIAMNARDLTGLLLASGIIIMVGVQVIINIAVVTSSMPPTGIILPFISYGGNALLIFMGAMGILLNISKSSDF
ncbi:MAG: putative lipid II flippase FtsW [Firmicutes bacterium]|nr:putative lipid II flippase FtsW [Bacillota bacterium]